MNSRTFSPAHSASIRSRASAVRSPDRYNNRYARFSTAISSVLKPARCNPHHVDTDRLHIESRAKQKRRHVHVHAGVPADHRQSANFRKLMNHHAAGQKSLIAHIDIPRHKRATRNHNVAPDPAVMGDVTRSHHVVFVADLSHRFRFRSARNRVVFPNLIPQPDLQELRSPVNTLSSGSDPRTVPAEISFLSPSVVHRFTQT